MKKYSDKNGKVAVLYSPGYGAGWYSWNKDYQQCLFSPEVVQLVLDNKEITSEFCKELFGAGFYAGGAKDLKILWIDPGTQFEISEYDGNECLKTRHGTDWLTA